MANNNVVKLVSNLDEKMTIRQLNLITALKLNMITWAKFFELWLKDEE